MIPEQGSNAAASTLEEKVQHAQEIIAEALRRFGDYLVLAWTGGKDSTTMLWLYKQVCDRMGRPLPRCIFINEGDVFDEIREQVDSVSQLWGVEVIEIQNDDVLQKVRQPGDSVKVDALNERNKAELRHIDFQGEEFLFHPESFAGNHLMKTVPLKAFIEGNQVKAVSTAIRWDEQEARRGEIYCSERDNPPHTRVQPMLHFTERDIWDVIHANRIPYCSLYTVGYRSLGAQCSTYKNADIPAWQQDLDNTPEREGRGQDKEQTMEHLRFLGYM